MYKWSTGYEIVKLVVKLAFWLSHKRITIIGKENIPLDQPVIFAPNHQNALMDPLAIVCSNKTQPVWLARADIFRLKFVRVILQFLKMMPVYRIRDGKDNLEKNEDVFLKAIQILEHKKALGLFPEAAHSGKRQMLSHKKAVPRIAFLAEEKNKFKLNLKVIPVGIYYDHYWHFNRSLLVNYGKPIVVSNFQQEYTESEHKATMALRKEIGKSLEELTLNIKSKIHYENYELIRELLGKQFARENRVHKNNAINQFVSDKTLIKILEQKEMDESETMQMIHLQLDHYRNLLEENQLNDKKIRLINTDNWKIASKILITTLFLPILIVGILLFGLSFYMSRYYIQKKVNDPAFISTFQFVTGLLIHIILVIVYSIIVFIITKNIIITILFIPGSLLIGKIAYQIFETSRDLGNIVTYLIQKKNNKPLFNEIEESRKACIQSTRKLIFN